MFPSPAPWWEAGLLSFGSFRSGRPVGHVLRRCPQGPNVERGDLDVQGSVRKFGSVLALARGVTVSEIRFLKTLRNILWPPVGSPDGGGSSRDLSPFSLPSAPSAPTTGFLNGGAFANAKAPPSGTAASIRTAPATGFLTSNGGKRPVKDRKATGPATPTCRSGTTSNRRGSGSGRRLPGRLSGSKRGEAIRNIP